MHGLSLVLQNNFDLLQNNIFAKEICLSWQRLEVKLMNLSGAMLCTIKGIYISLMIIFFVCE